MATKRPDLRRKCLQKTTRNTIAWRAANVYRLCRSHGMTRRDARWCAKGVIHAADLVATWLPYDRD